MQFSILYYWNPHVDTAVACPVFKIRLCPFCYSEYPSMIL